MLQILSKAKTMWSIASAWVGPVILVMLGTLVLILGFLGSLISLAAIGIVVLGIGGGNLFITISRHKEKKKRSGGPNEE